MGSQIPPNTVRFDASFGRRLLHDPAYLRVGALARCAWFEANLIATEFDGVFAEEALVARMTQALSFYMSGPEVTGLWPWSVIPRGVIMDECIDPLIGGGLIAPDDEGWYRIVGWDKWQPDPFAKPKAARLTPAEKQKAYRERRKAAVTAVTASLPDVTSRARTSSSSSSSKTVARTRARGDDLSIEEETRRAMLKKMGFDPDNPPKPHVLTDINAAV